MHNQASSELFIDVEKGTGLSARNQNLLHAAVRELQQSRPVLNAVKFELHRIDTADVNANRPDRNDGAIGTVAVSEGDTTIHVIERTETSPGVFTLKVIELSSEMKRAFSNAGQKFFSRDEVFAMASLGGSYLPFKMAGAEKIILKTTSTIAAAVYATDEITPGFATADVYDWNADGTKLIKTNKTCRVANMADGTVADATFIQAFMLGKVYVVDWELC